MRLTEAPGYLQREDASQQKAQRATGSAEPAPSEAMAVEELVAAAPSANTVKAEEVSDDGMDDAASSSSVQILSVESTPWERRMVKKEVEAKPSGVHLIGNRSANIKNANRGHHWLGEELTVVSNPFLSEPASTMLTKIGQGNHRLAYLWNDNVVLKLAGDHGNEMHYAAKYPAFAACIFEVCKVRIRLVSQHHAPFLMESTGLLQRKVAQALPWLEANKEDKARIKEFMAYAFAIAAYFASQKVKLRDIGPSNLAIRAEFDPPRICFYDLMSWEEARPRKKAYAWTGLWRLLERFAPEEVNFFRGIRLKTNSWPVMFELFAQHCPRYHQHLMAQGVRQPDGKLTQSE